MKEPSPSFLQLHSPQSTWNQRSHKSWHKAASDGELNYTATQDYTDIKKNNLIIMHPSTWNNRSDYSHAPNENIICFSFKEDIHSYFDQDYSTSSLHSQNGLANCSFCKVIAKRGTAWKTTFDSHLSGKKITITFPKP